VDDRPCTGHRVLASWDFACNREILTSWQDSLLFLCPGFTAALTAVYGVYIWFGLIIWLALQN
jgi:hypothetical protein